jgi:hypothetical protein
VSAGDPELAAYDAELAWILDQICVSLQGLTAAQLNWRPPTGAANSACAIVTHVVGSTRVYALGFGGGRPVARDRAAELAAAGSDGAALIASVRALAAERGAALAALAPADLDQRLTPAPELWGTGPPREISRREALVESVRHAALHLGEVRLTRDLALAQPA